ncbi:MAG: lytic transglycosylase domain-containing protein [Patescibacteria group bacterium]
MRRVVLCVCLSLALFLHTAVSAEQALFTRSEPCPVDVLFPLAREMALRTPVSHSEKVVSFFETQIHSDSTSPRRGSDFSTRTIPLVLMNLSTCELVETSVTRHINQSAVATMLSSNDGRFIVFVEPRPYGALWNWWNTPLQVLAPEQWVVAAIHWTLRPSGESVAYTPGSADLMNSFPSLVEIGRYHVRGDIQKAYEILEKTNSRALPHQTIPDVIETYFPRLLESIISIEHADDHEVAEYRSGAYAVNPIDRPFAVIGANPERAYSITRSPVGARGLMQVMPKTCRETRPLYGYPVPAGCSTDSHSHPTELASAMIIIDDHLSALMQRLRKGTESRDAFCRRPEIKLMLRASYNTGPRRVGTAIKKEKDWASRLLRETRGYLVKAFGLD